MRSQKTLILRINLMRYLGNKETICSEIVELIYNKVGKENKVVLFDAFCGTGTIANALKDNFSIVLNDNLKLATTFSAGRIYKGHCEFKCLGFEPISFFNSNKNTIIGFFSKNYSPALSGRFFTTMATWKAQYLHIYLFFSDSFPL